MLLYAVKVLTHWAMGEATWKSTYVHTVLFCFSLYRLVVCQHSGGAGLGAGHIPGLPECNQRRFGFGDFQDRRR